MSEEQGKELMELAKKKLGGFSFFGSSSKQEEAAELYVKAANMFKMGKKWNEAGMAFAEAANLRDKLGDKHQTATLYNDAANAYKKTDSPKAITFIQKAVKIYIDMGRFAIAAKHQVSTAELYEVELVDLDSAIRHYQTAAEWFQGEDSNAAANKALLKVATLSATRKHYDKAIEIYESVAGSAIENTLLKYSAKEYFLRAALCHMATGDIVTAQRAVTRYKDIFASFQDTREYKFCCDLLETLDEKNIEDYTAVVTEYDSISRLDAWFTSILLHIKQSISEEPSLT